MPVADVIEATTVCYGQAQNQLNVMHWRVKSITGVEPTMAMKASSVSASFAALIRPMIANTVTYKGLKMRKVEPAPTAAIIDTTGNGLGALAGDDLPPQVCGLVSLRASTAPPRVRGRWYGPQVTEGSNDTLGVPTAGYKTALGTVAAFLSSDITVVNGANNCVLTPVIWRRAPFHTWYDIDQTLVRGSWATQRRRSGINRGDTPAI